MKKIKVGIVSYLNTRPLIYGLKVPPVSDHIDLVEEYPARLVNLLLNDEIDIGLIPVAAIPEFQEHHIVGEHCIGTEGEAASVCLFSEVQLEDIRKVYLDYQSRTSVALLKWIMRDYWGIRPQIVQAQNEDYRSEITGTTAGLVIGDRAFEQRKISTFFYDLGSEWRSITGLPFVFAAWVSKRKFPEDFIRMFDAGNAIGLKHIKEIVAEHSFELYDLQKYYTLHMNYKLDDRKKQAMQYFLQLITAEK